LDVLAGLRQLEMDGQGDLLRSFFFHRRRITRFVAPPALQIAAYDLISM
jgi:hypothetical protein